MLQGMSILHLMHSKELNLFVITHPCLSIFSFCAAWDIAVTLMECGEIAQVKTLPRFAYGEEGKSPNIPRNATITYELELLEVLAPFDFGSLTEEAVMELV